MTEQASTDNASATLEIYKLAVEMADRVSSRRGAANTFFVGAATGLVAVAGVVSGIPDATNAIVRAIGVSGILLCLTWWLQLRSYRALNKAKFAVIQDVEKQLPVAIYTDEWKLLDDKKAPWRERFSELGKVERFVPLLFVALYVYLIWLVR